MITHFQYQEAQQIVSQYQQMNSKFQNVDPSNSIIKLMNTHMSQQLFNVIVDYICPKKRINQRNITLNDVSRLTEDEIKEMPKLGIAKFNQLNDVLFLHGFNKFPFYFPK